MLAATLSLVLLAVGAEPDEQQTYTDDSAFAASNAAEWGHLCGAGMPQTCYAPRYGCYPGNGRYTHRYPAFHGVYYRRPYNYRNLFDYPWHAELHEPTSMFSYHVPAPEEVQTPRPDDAPRPPRDASAQSRLRSVMVPARSTSTQRR